MWDEIFTVLAIANMVLFVIAFMGYWTCADYFMNLHKNYQLSYAIAQGAILVIAIEILLICGFLSNFNEGLTAAIATTGLGSIVCIIILFITVLIKLFFKSRKYFVNKRKINN